jgi:RNA-directed DNA polymerase
MKDRVRQMTSRNRGRNMAQVCKDRAYLPGWRNYFQLVDLPTLFRELDSWIRHRLIVPNKLFDKLGLPRLAT